LNHITNISHPLLLKYLQNKRNLKLPPSPTNIGQNLSSSSHFPSPLELCGLSVNPLKTDQIEEDGKEEDQEFDPIELSKSLVQELKEEVHHDNKKVMSARERYLQRKMEKKTN